MNTKENYTPYESPISVCIRLNLAGIVCQSGKPGEDVPYDPGHDQELGSPIDNTIFNIPGDELNLLDLL